MAQAAHDQAIVSPLDDPAAFRALYDEHFAHVWRTLRRLGVQAAHLEDAAHEVFLTCYRRRDAYDPERPVRPWLSGIAWRVASHARRAVKARREVSGPVPDRADSGPGPEALLRRRQAADLVQAALEALDDDRREVFVLNVIDGVPIPEVAELVGVPLGTCYSRLRSAKSRFEAAVKRIRAREATR